MESTLKIFSIKTNLLSEVTVFLKSRRVLVLLSGVIKYDVKINHAKNEYWKGTYMRYDKSNHNFKILVHLY